jgi:hypothetical protein
MTYGKAFKTKRKKASDKQKRTYELNGKFSQKHLRFKQYILEKPKENSNLKKKLQ